MYVVKRKIRFTNAHGITQVCDPGDIVTFEEGDDVRVDDLLKLGVIEVYEAPEELPAEPDKPKRKRGKPGEEVD
jgi:hypothetical protein